MLASLRGSPVVRAACTSCCIMAAGDALCSVVRAKASGTDIRMNWRQTARFGLVGLTLHGPFFFHAYRWLDTRFGQAATLQRAFVKTMAGQVTVFPVYASLFLAYMGLLEGMAPAQIARKWQQAFPTIFATGSAFWPLANVINFMYAPPSARVLFANVAGLFWNAFLSYENSTKGRVQPALAIPCEDSSSGPRRGGSDGKKQA